MDLAHTLLTQRLRSLAQRDRSRGRRWERPSRTPLQPDLHRRTAR
ncbi:MAG TPA: hypothetical protein VKK81_08930 [Candidatus Binatia bacterium]|nr:hypothetical protein [Candidatus Binatia bacterium]